MLRELSPVVEVVLLDPLVPELLVEVRSLGLADGWHLVLLVLVVGAVPLVLMVAADEP